MTIKSMLPAVLAAVSVPLTTANPISFDSLDRNDARVNKRQSAALLEYEHR